VTDHAVLIAAAELLPPLKARLGAETRDLLVFSDVEALRALEAITARRPSTVLLERSFAATPRGAALINRIKADPALASTQIRVVANDNGITPEPLVADPVPVAEAPPARVPHPTQPPPQLDYQGTRRTTRFLISDPTDILVDGNRGSLVNLSRAGGQLLTSSILKPNQRVRVSLTDDAGTVRCIASVVWAKYEIPKGTSPRYRVGLEFIDPDGAALDGFIRRHKQD
jgi:hypothetical protein